LGLRTSGMNGTRPVTLDRSVDVCRVGDLEMEEGMPKKVFLRETLEKEVRLSYLERIQRTLPEEYFAVFPTKPDVDDWKPISGSTPHLP
jgi:hypothetical protein